MKRFHFPLEPVLRWRGSRVETEQARLRELIERQARLAGEREDLDRQLDAVERSVVEPAVPGVIIEPDRLSELDRFRSYVRQRQGILREAESRLESEISAQRLRVVAARRQCRLLEALRDRAVHRWRVEWERELDRLAGELFLAQWTPRAVEADLTARSAASSGTAEIRPDRG